MDEKGNISFMTRTTRQIFSFGLSHPILLERRRRRGAVLYYKKGENRKRKRNVAWKTKWNFVTAYGERQLGPTHKERIDKRRRDPFKKRKRCEPQEQVTETQSEGRTRYVQPLPTNSEGILGKETPRGEGMAPGNKNWLRMPNRPTERGKSLLLQK
jgi:hypothetical protein